MEAGTGRYFIDRIRAHYKRGDRAPADTILNRTAPKEALSFAFTDFGLNGFYRAVGNKGLVRIFKSEIIDAHIILLWGGGLQPVSSP